MSETAALEISEPTVETQRIAGAETVSALPEPERNLAVDITLAQIAGDRAEVARLEALAAKPAPVETKTVEETPKPEEVAAKVEADEAAKEEAEEAEELEAQQSGETPTKKGFRTRFSDPEDVAIATLARTQKIPLAEAARIRGEITGKAKEQEAVQTEIPQADPTITALEVEVAGIEQEYRNTYKADAMDENLPEIQIKLSRANAKLEAVRSEAKALGKMLEISKHEKTVSSQAEFDRRVEEFKAETAKDFPDMKDKESPQAMLAEAYARQMQDPKHPDHAKLFEPNVVRFLAEKAAAKLKLEPATAPTPVPKPAEKTVARPAAGSKGSAPPAPQATAQQIVETLRSETVKAIAGGHFAAGKSGTTHLSGTIIY